ILCTSRGDPCLVGRAAPHRRARGARGRADLDGSGRRDPLRYLGPTAATKPLASGHVRRQIGLKLRAPETTAPVASVPVWSSHKLRAILEGDELAVWADGVLAWEGVLPSTLLGL